MRWRCPSQDLVRSSSSRRFLLQIDSLDPGTALMCFFGLLLALLWLTYLCCGKPSCMLAIQHCIACLPSSTMLHNPENICLSAVCLMPPPGMSLLMHAGDMFDTSSTMMLCTMTTMYLVPWLLPYCPWLQAWVFRHACSPARQRLLPPGYMCELSPAHPACPVMGHMLMHASHPGSMRGLPETGMQCRRAHLPSCLLTPDCRHFSWVLPASADVIASFPV